jgi:hypothetical protein
VYVRIKKPPAVWDALSYCVATLERGDATYKEKTRVNAMIADIFEKESSREMQTRYQHFSNNALARIYELTQETNTKSLILDFMDTQIHAQSRFFMKVVEPLAELSPTLLNELLSLMQKKQSPEVWDEILTVLATQIEMHPDCGYRLCAYEGKTSQLVFSQLKGKDLLACLNTALKSVCFEEHGSSMRLEGLLSQLSERAWTQEQLDTVRQSFWPATAVLLQLYLSACSAQSTEQLATIGALPFTQWQPLPFLRMLYPEKAPLWRNMELGILDMPLTPELKASNGQRLMVNLFEMFAQSFATEKTHFNTCRGVIESMGIAPLDYFRSCMQMTMTPVFELPDDMFSFS